MNTGRKEAIMANYFVTEDEKEDFIHYLKAGGRVHPEEIRFVYQRFINDAPVAAPVFFAFASPQEFLELFNIEPEDTILFHMFSYGGEIYEDCKHMYDLERFAISKSA